MMMNNWKKEQKAQQKKHKLRERRTVSKTPTTRPLQKNQFMSSKIKFDVLNSVGCSCKCVEVNQLEYSLFIYLNYD